jgi:hypothetical protein
VQEELVQLLCVGAWRLAGFVAGDDAYLRPETPLHQLTIVDQVEANGRWAAALRRARHVELVGRPVPLQRAAREERRCVRVIGQVDKADGGRLWLQLLIHIRSQQ